MAQSIPTLEVVVLSEGEGGELPFRHGLDSCWLGDSMKKISSPASTCCQVFKQDDGSGTHP